jgi:pyrimidine operon attenuation protein/uracil phosphoribosyltransferase
MMSGRDVLVKDSRLVYLPAPSLSGLYSTQRCLSDRLGAVHDRNRALARSSSLHVLIMDEQAVRRAVARMAREIVEQNAGPGDLALLGIQRRGVQIADLLRSEIERAEGVTVATGSLDITLYRDDLMAIGPRPVVGATVLPEGGVDERAVVIVDDVLFTGRTIRAALNELTDWGRPARVSLCVLVDREGRELPIQPNVVGKVITVLPDQSVEVSVPDHDGRWSVDIVPLSSEAET